jgi:hypothetical protein
MRIQAKVKNISFRPVLTFACILSKIVFSRKEFVAMKIKVNDKLVEIFSGACVKDALRKYSSAEWKKVQKNQKAVFDRHGHEVAPDGELSGGEEFFIKSVEAEKPKP